MNHTPRIALLGFLPWSDPQRGVAVRENPSAITADLCARDLAAENTTAAFIPVPVSNEGVLNAVEMVRILGANVVVALGQTSTEPRVERFGRVPCSSAPHREAEANPWLLAHDADELVPALNALNDPAAQVAPFRASDDAGGYFCDHLCVELTRDARERGTHARFLHITATDGCTSGVRDARIRQYVRQTRAAVNWLLRVSLAALLLAGATASAGEVKTNDTLAQIQARGKLRWGMDAQGGAPYVFQSPMDPNLIVGFEVDVADAIAQRLHVQAVPMQGQWEDLLELLRRGDFDIALNGIEVADEKRRICDLSHPYFAAAERLTIRRGDKNAPHTLAELKGRAIGTLPGSLAERILIREGAIAKTYEGGQNEIYDDLKIGRTAGVLLDQPITHYFADIEPELEVADGSFGEVQYAVAVRQGDDALLTALNQSIDSLAADGTLRRIYEKWDIWTPETAHLFNQDPAPQSSVAEAYESWRAAVGKLPPLSERLLHRYPQTFGIFGRAAALTLAVSIASMALAIALGLLLAFARVFGAAPLRLIATTYVEFFRGTPLLIQLIMIYFGLPELGVTLNPFVAGWLALGLNYAAAEAENYRTGILSVPAGQLDAAAVLGLTRFQTLRYIVAPQAMRIALPPATNDFIALLKDSSLVSIVTLTELTKAYGNLANSMRDHLGLGVMVAVWYLIIGLPFARLARMLETRLGRHLRPIG